MVFYMANQLAEDELYERLFDLVKRCNDGNLKSSSGQLRFFQQRNSMLVRISGFCSALIEHLPTMMGLSNMQEFENQLTKLLSEWALDAPLPDIKNSNPETVRLQNEFKSLLADLQNRFQANIESQSPNKRLMI